MTGPASNPTRATSKQCFRESPTTAPAKLIQKLEKSICIHSRSKPTEAGGRVAYFVFYSDYPEGTEDDTDPKVLLQNARDGVIGDDDSRQTREEKIDISGHPGLEFDFVQGNGANKTYGYWRLYMVKNRLYQIGIISIGEQATDFKVKAIYDSFNLLKP